MHKILVEVKKNALSFSLYSLRDKVENINNTNVVNTDKMIFSDSYINNNLDLIRSFFNLIVIKNNIDKVNISINAIFPLVFRIIKDMETIKTVSLLEDKTISYIIFEYLLESKYIENVDCYSIPSFMFDKLDIDKNMKINSRCEVLFLSNFMEKNDFNNYSDIYYKKSVDIDCNLKKIDKEDVESFFRFNNKVKVINLFSLKKESIDFILSLIKSNNKKNIKIVLNQENDGKDIIKFADQILNENKKLFKDNNLRIKINYTKEYRDKNMMKQVNLSFFRFILIIFIILAVIAIVLFYLKYNEDTDDINKEMDNIDELVDQYLQEEETLVVPENEDEEEPIVEDNNSSNTGESINNNGAANEGTTNNKPSNSKPSPYYRTFEQVFDDLLKINNETVGWLKVNNTKINYPVTRHSDNDYYLNYSYYKQKNSHGWIFMDYRNNIDILDKNTIIYGHRNSKGLMFGTLKNVLDKSWYTNKNNQIITFNTLNQDMKWEIFSIYTLENTSDYLMTNFSNDTSYINFINKIKGRSIYDFGVEVGLDDNILTLSTCYNNAKYRLVVHARLIK